MRNRTLALGIVIMSLFSFSAHALADTGFVNDPIWLSPAAPKNGQTVKLTALFHNGEAQSLSGTVLFYDGDTLMGQKKLVIASDGVGVATTSFTINAGTHSFSASMSSVSEVSTNGTATPYTLPIQTVHLSAVTVSAASVASTNPSTSLDIPSAEILAQVNDFGNTALSVVPPSVQGSLSTDANDGGVFS